MVCVHVPELKEEKQTIQCEKDGAVAAPSVFTSATLSPATAAEPWKKRIESALCYTGPTIVYICSVDESIAFYAYSRTFVTSRASFKTYDEVGQMSSTSRIRAFPQHFTYQALDLSTLPRLPTTFFVNGWVPAVYLDMESM